MAPQHPGGQVRLQTSGWSNHGEHKNGEPEPDTSAERCAACRLQRAAHRSDDAGILPNLKLAFHDSACLRFLRHLRRHATPDMPRAVGGVETPERPEPEHRAPARSPVSTCIGTPDGMSRIETAHALTALVNEAYGYRRVSDWDMQHRLRAGSRRLPPAPEPMH